MRSRIFGYIGFLFIVGLSGCIVINSGCSGKESYTRTVELSEPLTEGSSLKVETTNGSIDVQGQETTRCSVTANITGQASTSERAQELAEQTEIRLEPHDGGLRTVIVMPEKDKRESVSVGFEIIAPNKVSLDASTTNGKIRTGSIIGNQALQTTNGSIYCGDVNGTLNAHTTNGSVEVNFASQASAAVNASINTTNGSISIGLPKDCSAKVDAGVVNGKIKSEQPLKIMGPSIDRDTLSGILGTGDGKLSLHTVNGSINLH